MPIAQNTNALYLNASYLGVQFNDEELKQSYLLLLNSYTNVARTSISDDE